MNTMTDTVNKATATLQKEAIDANMASAKENARELDQEAKRIANMEAQATSTEAKDKYAYRKAKVKEVLNNVTEKVLENSEKAGDFIADKATELLNKFKK